LAALLYFPVLGQSLEEEFRDYLDKSGMLLDAEQWLATWAASLRA